MIVPPVYINGVAHGLEGVERNTHRQYQIQRRNPVADAHSFAEEVHCFSKEIRILKGEKQSQIHADTGHQKELHEKLIVAIFFHSPTAEIVHSGRKNQQQN